MKFWACILLFFLISTPKIFAQREAANWYFGDKAGLNFNGGNAASLQNGKLQTLEGSATISDREGNLLFYTDGSVVYNRLHNIMPNGTGLKGNVSSTQSAIIVPKPGNPNKYYIFTVDKPNFNNDSTDPIEGINYTEVDMTLNGGFGGIIPGSQNVHLVSYNPNDPEENLYKASEKISAVLHGDGSSYWVVTHFVNKFYAFKVTAEGVNTNAVISNSPVSFPPVIDNELVNVTAIGYLKISPDGKKLAIAFSATGLNSAGSSDKKSGKVLLYDFDDVTGKVSNEQLILANAYPYGVEFSPKTTKLYITSNNYNDRNVLEKSELFQYDMEAGNIRNSEVLIHSSNHVAGALQLATDGRIYRAGYPLFTEVHNTLSVIKNPEAAGAASNYEHNVINISPKAVKLGLPPFVQSFFLNNFSFEDLCFGEATHFYITTNEPYTSVLWDFGDGNTSTDPDPYHTYSSSGSYIVSFTRFLNGEAFEPAKKEVVIFESPEILATYEMVQCDRDANPSDGVTEFNLRTAKDAISPGETNTNVYFYNTYNKAIDDELNQLSLPVMHINAVPNEVLFAKVVDNNTGCFAISEVTLKTTGGTEILPAPEKGCDLGDGTAEFNLESIESNIISQLNLPQDVELSFHHSEEEAILGTVPLPDRFISEARTVFLNARLNGSCYGFGSIELQLTSFPEIEVQNQQMLCSDAFPIRLGSDLVFNDSQSYSYEWNTGETSREIEISEGGNYSVTITNTSLGCGRTVEYNIEELTSPEILEINIESNGADNEITVITNSEAGNLYALDNIDGPYQSSDIFRNVPGGPHIVYVKNENSCAIKQQEILVFGVPPFFTPNQDGYNDLWLPFKISDPEFVIREIYIYDRYGKILEQLDPYGKGWDGNFGGNPMPSDDYWYQIILQNGKEFKGHFTLKR